MEALEETKQRLGTKSKVFIFSRWTQKGDVLHPEVTNLFSTLKSATKTFYSRRIAKPEGSNGSELENMLLGLENRLDVIFGKVVRDCASKFLEGPFPGILTRSGIVFGTKQAPPKVGSTIDVEVFLNGSRPLLFDTEVEVKRVKMGQDGNHYIAGCFKSIPTTVEVQIMRYVSQNEKA